MASGSGAGSTGAAGRGTRLGIDVGSVRVGVARSDADGILATPVTTLVRDAKNDSDMAELVALVAKWTAVEVVVGLPRTLRGTSGAAVRSARAYGDKLAALIAPTPIVYVDERLTSVHANRILTERRIRGKSRREVVDQIAAVEILQSRLDALRRSPA